MIVAVRALMSCSDLVEMIIKNRFQSLSLRGVRRRFAGAFLDSELSRYFFEFLFGHIVCGLLISLFKCVLRHIRRAKGYSSCQPLF